MKPARSSSSKARPAPRLRRRRGGLRSGRLLATPWPDDLLIPVLWGTAFVGTAATVGITLNEAKGDGDDAETAPERDPAQDKRLTNSDIQKLKDAGIDIHAEKGRRNPSKKDLFKDRDGNV